MAKARPDRETVLLWIELQQAGAAAAARHFGLPAPTVRRWCAEARAKPERAPAERSANAQKRAPVGDPPPRGAEEAIERSPRSASPGLAGMPGRDRERVLGFKERALDFLDSEAAIKAPRDARDLLGALTTLIAAVPDLMAFDARLAGELDDHGRLAGAGAAGGDDAAARVRAALGGDPGPSDPG